MPLCSSSPPFIFFLQNPLDVILIFTTDQLNMSKSLEVQLDWIHKNQCSRSIWTPWQDPQNHSDVWHLSVGAGTYAKRSPDFLAYWTCVISSCFVIKRKTHLVYASLEGRIRTINSPYLSLSSEKGHCLRLEQFIQYIFSTAWLGKYVRVVQYLQVESIEFRKLLANKEIIRTI